MNRVIKTKDGERKLENIRFAYIKERLETGEWVPIGCVALWVEDGKICTGWSICGELDAFKYKVARSVALQPRLVPSISEIPSRYWNKWFGKREFNWENSVNLVGALWFATDYIINDYNKHQK